MRFRPVLRWLALAGSLLAAEAALPRRPEPPPRATAAGTFGHVVLVTEENTNYASVIGSSSMPYLNALAKQYGLATQYYANTHPSIGNYFELATGQVLTNDDNSSTIQTVDNVVRELLTLGKTWKSYAEDLPAVGYLGGDQGNYARKHNVFALLSDVANDATQAKNIVPFTQFASDLKNGALPSFANVVPNLCNDAHDCSLSTADTWLKNNLAPLIASPLFQADGLLIITFDEAGSDNTNGGGKVAWVVVSPQAAPGFQSTTKYQHPSTLRLILSALGGSTFPGAASSAPNMTEFFQTSPPPTGTVASVSVAPSAASLIVGQTAQFAGTAKDASGVTLSGQTFVWASGTPAVATISSSGLATAVSAGAATLSATDGGKVGTAALTVTQLPQPPPTGTCQTSGLPWASFPLAAAQTGTFTAEFDVAPSAANLDAVTGFGPKPVAGYADMGVIVRFNSTGTIDVRNDGGYTATTNVPYSGGTTYHFKLTINVPGHSYAATVTPVGGATSTLATVAAFRTEQATASSLGYWALESDAGTHTVCNLLVSSPTITPVASVTVSPATVSLAVGGTAQLAAVAKDASGVVLTGRTFAWGTSSASVATVGATGLVTGAGAGTATITATSEGKSGAAAVVVASTPPPAVASVSVSPSTATVGVGQTAQLTATAADATGTVVPGQTFAWVSAAPAIASVSGVGVVTGVAAGGTTVTASASGHSGSASITVPAPPPVGTCITSGVAWVSLPLAAVQTGTFATTFDLTPNGSALDAVTGLGAASISGYTGMAAIVRFNSTGTIDVRNGGNYTAATSVPYAAGKVYHVRLTVSVPTHTYSAYVTPPGGGEVALGINVAFRTEQAAASSLGYWALESDAGTHAVCGFTLGGGAPPPTVASVSVAPATVTLAAGQTVQLIAMAKDASGTGLPGQPFTWTSSATLATVSGSGLVTGVASGTATITATASNGVRGTAAIVVTAGAPTVAAVTVSPATTTLAPGGTVQLTAVAKDATGVVIAGQIFAWATSDSKTATVSTGGLVTGVAAGSATMTATTSGKSGSAAITVASVPPPPPPPTSGCGNTGSGTCYYVATNGNDGNAGTSSAPFRTLQKAASVVGAGDGVLVGDGVYTGGITISASGTSANWIVFKAAHKWAAIIDGNNFAISANVSIRGNYIRVEGFDIRRSDRGGVEAYNGSELQATNHDVMIVANHIHDIGRICTDDTGGRSGVEVYASNVTVDGNLIENIGRLAPGEQGCNPSSSNYQNHDHGIYAAVGDNTLIKNNVFYNCLRGWPVHRYSGGGATMNGFVIANNTFSDPNPWKAGQVIIGGKTNGLVIENNIFNNPTTAGIWYDAGDGGTWAGAIQRNNLSTTAVATGASVGGGGDLANATPRFAGSRDYHLQSGSPGVNQGISLSQVLTDFDGIARPQGGAYDIGAYER